MNPSNNGYVPARVLKFQLGFLLEGTRGQISETEIDIPRLRVAEDVTVDFLRGALRFSRTSRGILVQGLLHSQVVVECSRCLTETPALLTIQLEELYLLQPNTYAEFTIGEDGVLDLAPLLRQEIILETPTTPLCKPDCLGLCPECGQNLNEGTCSCQREVIDPRLAALKALREKLSKPNE
ncbi:MAG: YceD family protein [Aggregatilineales bacterium]